MAAQGGVQTLGRPDQDIAALFRSEGVAITGGDVDPQAQGLKRWANALEEIGGERPCRGQHQGKRSSTACRSKVHEGRGHRRKGCLCLAATGSSDDQAVPRRLQQIDRRLLDGSQHSAEATEESAPNGKGQVRHRLSSSAMQALVVQRRHQRADEHADILVIKSLIY